MLNVRIITIMPKKLTTEEWINKARIKHGDKYDYSKSVYTGSRDRIIITCPKHGDFTAISGLHISRGDGCPECASLAKSSKLSLSNEEFINRLRDMFGDNYDYSKVKYNGIQHYNSKMAFGGSFKFERQQARDEYVRQYCKDNNIKLIEIRYDEDVWEVLTRELLDNQTTNEECK